MDIKLKETLRIVGYYTFFGLWWIFFSDRLLSHLITDMRIYKVIQVYKGTLFILITALLLFKLIHRSYMRIDSLDKQLQETLAELREKQSELEELAYVDHLTGLASRRLIDEKFDLLFENSRRSGALLSLVMIDIDYFKRFNDRYGHLEGDQVLTAMGSLLKKVFKRESDVIGRYGGEEFLVILYDTSTEDTLRLVETFQKTLEDEDILHEGSPYGRLTVSAGINSFTPGPAEESEIALRNTDSELYKAKNAGRNRYSVRS